MKAEELRLKNIIGWRLGTGALVVGKVHGIEPDKIAISEKETSFDEHGEVESSQGFIKIGGIEPIPLTEDWLKKFGFEYNGGDGWKAPNGEHFYHSLRNGFIHQMYRHTAFKGVQFVHQLQNLYYALTGSDLTLKE